MARHFGGVQYERDGRWGAYGEGNRKQGKIDAEEHARALRNDGYLARVTLERMDYGQWWVCWKGPKKLVPSGEFELVTNKLPLGDPPWSVKAPDRATAIKQVKKKLKKGERIVSLKQLPRLSR